MLVLFFVAHKLYCIPFISSHNNSYVKVDKIFYVYYQKIILSIQETVIMIIEIHVVLGGILLGVAAGIMLLVRGRILGCSGILFRSWDFTTYRPNIDNISFIVGLFLSGALFNFLQTVPNPAAVFKTNYELLILGGILVGGGTYLGNGCTSGHGLCGISLLRKRSIIAVSIFFPIAIITSWLTH